MPSLIQSKSLILSVALLVGALGLVPPRSYAQASEAAGKADDSAARKARILANLRHAFPQFDEVPMEVLDIVPTGTEGLEEGTVLANGLPRPFLITVDDSGLWLLASTRLDARGTAEQILAADVEERQALRAQLEVATQGRPQRGPADAKVSIVEFSDFECPNCARNARVLDEVLAAHPADVRLVALAYPNEELHAWARTAALAVACTSLQDEASAWVLRDAYFAREQQLDLDVLREIGAASLADSRVDLDSWWECVSDPASGAHQAAMGLVEDDIELGLQMGVPGTPSVFINGELLAGRRTVEALVEHVEALLKSGR